MPNKIHFCQLLKGQFWLSKSVIRQRELLQLRQLKSQLVNLVIVREKIVF